MLELLDAPDVPARVPLEFPIVRVDSRVEDAGYVASLLRADEPARAAYVVTLAGSQDARSHLASWLRTKTPLPIVEADAPVRVEPGHVYFVAASSGLSVDGCMLERIDDRRYRDIVQPLLDHAAEVIAQTARLQTRLVDDPLDVSRLDMPKLAIERQPLSLTTVVAESLSALGDELTRKNISLDLALADEPLVVLADPERIAQVVWNLVNNATRFTPHGGRIAIRAGRDADRARLDVEDSGQGIPEEFLPQVFELFSQQESSTARRYMGVGVGLALVRELVDLHGGRVEAFSAGEGKGSRFSVWLPLETHETQAFACDDSHALDSGAPWTRPAPDTASPRLNGLRVLVVDDDASSAEAMRELLADEGARVEAACTAGDALALAQRQLFDVVISDIAMPGMDGHALLHALREDPRFAGVPAIACTGYASNADIDRARRSGFIAHLVKPLDIERVVTSVREVTAGRDRQ
jgi:two-component system CheB/CheR fusion protein